MLTDIQSLELFKSLIKDGCTWHGDVMSKKWSECLYYSEHHADAVKRTLEQYKEGEDYRREGEYAIWIS